MKRVMVRIALCLLLGMAAMVLTTWWSVQRGVVRATGPALSTEEGMALIGRVVDLKSLATPTVACLHEDGFAWREDIADGTFGATETGGRLSVTVVRYEQGWPMKALRGEHWFGPLVEEPGLRGVYAWRRGSAGDRMMAWRPMAVGFVVDCMVFTSPLLMIVAIAEWRRARKKKAGRCMHCGYDLRSGGVEHEKCPECGAEA
ncbi:MAG TPA: hypothetical protein VG711_12250 [Phycisphaerales bacterium]|nr:hypothetical protein [Phycisphaerales bacterium]